MRVLVVGGGGREHALVWALAKSALVEALYAAPGNAGIEELATCLPVGPEDRDGLIELVERERIDFTVVGPEAPLVAGLVDGLAERGHRAFGPTRAAARIEGSKAWAKELCEKYGVPAPASRTFTELGEAVGYLDALEPPFVVKADGLAAGKGVVVAPDRSEAIRALEDRLVRKVFGDAGSTVLIEEYLEGDEVSALALTDGRTVVPLALAQDFKRAEDGDRGPNTGGMGSYSPAPFVDGKTNDRIVREVLERTVEGLAAEGIEYRGVLYAGLMITAAGPKLLEFNCRFGDPETQAVLPRLGSDLAEALLATAEGRLEEVNLSWTERACVAVVLASGGYPGSYESGKEITGLETAAGLQDVAIFHAGTERRDGKVVTAGGRVVAVSALGNDLSDARKRAYEACSLISFEGMQHRTDIAEKAAGG
ncbi:MAG: phosphoribosylamine--glycine ligase [Actinomycetota bacterium]